MLNPSNELGRILGFLDRAANRSAYLWRPRLGTSESTIVRSGTHTVLAKRTIVPSRPLARKVRSGIPRKWPLGATGSLGERRSTGTKVSSCTVTDS